MNDFITIKFTNSQKLSAVPEGRIMMAIVKEWVLVSEDTPREDFWVSVLFLELGGVHSFYGMPFIYIFWSKALSVLYAILQ